MYAVEEEQGVDEEEADDDDEPEEEQHDAVTGDDGYNSDTDPVDDINHAHAVTTSLQMVTETNSPAMEDVLTSFSHLHLPGFQEVENMALLLLQLADDSNRYIIPTDVRQRIVSAAGTLHSRNFRRQYESKWGYTVHLVW